MTLRCSAANFPSWQFTLPGNHPPLCQLPWWPFNLLYTRSIGQSWSVLVCLGQSGSVGPRLLARSPSLGLFFLCPLRHFFFNFLQQESRVWKTQRLHFQQRTTTRKRTGRPLTWANWATVTAGAKRTATKQQKWTRLSLRNTVLPLLQHPKSIAYLVFLFWFCEPSCLWTPGTTSPRRFWWLWQAERAGLALY